MANQYTVEKTSTFEGWRQKYNQLANKADSSGKFLTTFHLAGGNLDTFNIPFQEEQSSGEFALIADTVLTQDRGNFAVDFQLSRANDSEIASGLYSSIPGGRSNTALGDYSIALGGFVNRAEGQYSIAAGRDSLAAEDYTLAIGRRAKSINTGSFILSDSQDSDVSSSKPNELILRFAGGAILNGSPLITENDLGAPAEDLLTINDLASQGEYNIPHMAEQAPQSFALVAGENNSVVVNDRGFDAVDLQLGVPSSADIIAAAPRSVLIGGEGNKTQVSAENSGIFAGSGSDVSGNNSAAIAGFNSVVSGNYAAVIGGVTGQAAGNNSASIGGGNALANNSIVLGEFGESNHSGSFVISSLPPIATTQSDELILGFENGIHLYTSGNASTPAILELHGSSSEIILASPDGTRYAITVDNAGNLQTAAA